MNNHRKISELNDTKCVVLATNGQRYRNSNPSSSAKKHLTTFVVGCFLHGGDSNRLNAICRWHIAATSSKTGGFLDFCPFLRVKMLSNPSSGFLRNPGVSFCSLRFWCSECSESQKRIFVFPYVFPYQLTDLMKACIRSALSFFIFSVTWP